MPPECFDHDDLQPLESVADICAAAIQNAHNFDRMKQLAYVDGLTGIHNRRYFEMRIVEELERAGRFQGRMSVIMVDIDHFKKMNDEFGHLLGDEMLRSVSTILKQRLRKIKWCAGTVETNLQSWCRKSRATARCAWRKKFAARWKRISFPIYRAR